MTLDPVCKMYVDNQSNKKTILYNETIYHFCSTLCKELFEKNPEKYLENNRKILSKINPLSQSLINISEIEA